MWLLLLPVAVLILLQSQHIREMIDGYGKSADFMVLKIKSVDFAP